MIHFQVSQGTVWITATPPPKRNEAVVNTPAFPAVKLQLVYEKSCVVGAKLELSSHHLDPIYMVTD